MTRLYCSLLTTVCIVVSTLGLSAGSLAKGEQPMPTGPVAKHGEGHADWLTSQRQDTTDEDRVKSTVDTYYRLKYDSWLDQTVYDFGFLFLTDDQTGRNTYAYERGRLQYLLAGWRASGTLLESYGYAAVYEQIDAQTDSATVVVRPRAYLVFQDTPERTDEYGTEPHRLVLARRNDRWLIQHEEYNDELTPVLPYGTDFDELTRALPQSEQAPGNGSRTLAAVILASAAALGLAAVWASKRQRRA